MADSVEERILADRKTALEAIDGTGSYNYTARKVERVQVFPQSEPMFPFIMLPQPAENYDEPLAAMPYGPVPTRMMCWVHGYLRADDNEVPADVGRLKQDILRAWMADPSCGDNAVVTYPQRSEPVAVVDVSNIVGIRIQFVVKYRWKLNEPTESI